VIDQDLAAIKAALEAGPTPAELAPTLKDGDKFTVAGLRRRPDGTYTKRCKPGNETVFTARYSFVRHSGVPVKPNVI
jgi:hypothetical protein